MKQQDGFPTGQHEAADGRSDDDKTAKDDKHTKEEAPRCGAGSTVTNALQIGA
jgi:hypothetical protein